METPPIIKPAHNLAKYLIYQVVGAPEPEGRPAAITIIEGKE